MVASRLLVVCTAVLAATTTTSLEAQDVAWVNARILDPATRTETRGALVARDGKFVAVGTLPAGFSGTRIDLGGRFVIPGFVDAHTHAFGNMSPGGAPQMLGADGSARMVLQAGVIAFLDLFAPEDDILGLRDRQRAGEVDGAAIFAAGPCFTATNGHCSEYGVPTRLVNSPAEVEREVTALAPKRPDVLKIVYDNASYGSRRMPTVDRATLEAFLAKGRALDIPSVVHVGTWDDVRHAVLGGATAVTHTPGGAVPDDLVRLMAERGTHHIPTLAVQGDFSRLVANRSMLDDPLLVAVTTEPLRAAYRSVSDTVPQLRGWLAWQRSQMAGNLASVATLARAGVPMLTGTDGGNFGVFQGYSVHREMELLVEAGLTPWDALRAATTHAATFLRQPWGLSAGNEATFLVLEASPLEDIRNTKRIGMVVQRGKEVK